MGHRFATPSPPPRDSPASGVITLGPDRNPVGKKIVIIAIKNGQLTLETTIDLNAPGAAK